MEKAQVIALKPVTGREYLRVSFDKSGREKSHGEQHDDNERFAPSLGVDRLVGLPYKDTGSASRHGKTRRDDFEQLLDDLPAGRFGADVLVMWESSRGSRKVSEWCQLIEACEEAGVRIAVTTHRRSYDPTNARDRKSLIEDANDSEYESAKISQRTKRDAEAGAVDGKPHGPVAFGYRRIYDEATRRRLAQEAHPDEAPIVVELFKRLCSGDSLANISRDFKSRGIRSRNGKVFSPQAIRQMALNLSYVGLRVHNPNRPAGSYAGRPENTYPAEWPALIDEETFYSVQALLLDPARKTYRPGRGKWLLSMIVRCDVCGGPLVVKYPHGERRYLCHAKTCVTVEADDLDRWVETQVLDFLTKPDLVDQFVPQADPVALAAARADVARIRAEHTHLIAEVGAGRATKAMMAAEPAILARQKLAEAEVQALVVPSGLRQLIQPGSQVTSDWQALDMTVKRQVVQVLFGKEGLKPLTITKASGKGGRQMLGRIRLDGERLRSVVGSQLSQPA